MMMALYGSRWSSQFGEQVDRTGQWTKTLWGVTRTQMAGALELMRTSGRAWPPTAPELRAMCLGQDQYPTPEAAYAQLHRYQTGQITVEQLWDVVRHTIYKNMDFYKFKQLTLEKAQEVFRFAYRATIDQLTKGEAMYQMPKPHELIEQVSEPVSAEDAEAARLNLLSMFEEDPPKPKTAKEIEDDMRLQKVKSQ